MSDRLDVIIVDDDPSVAKLISKMIMGFYIWGEVLSFSDVDEAVSYCTGRDTGVAIFVIDVFLGGKTGFDFLGLIEEKFPGVYGDAIIITGNASNDIVNMCIDSNVNYLLEKPIKPFALQLTVRAIVMKYFKFAKRLLRDQAFAASVPNF